MRIVAKGLTYTYNPKSPFASQALKGVDLTIEEGEFFGIIGHTGSGKSTFVQHLNALIKLTGGQLRIGGYDLADKKCKFLELRSKVGMVFQYPEYQLFADTVEKDVAFGLKNFRKDIKDEKEIAALVKDALETAGLDYNAVRERSPFELSGGQKRRVAIAGVIVTKPEILILDEPAAGLDPLGKKELMELLHAIHGSWCKTVVIVSHDMDEIAENCTRAAVFSEGKVVMEGKPSEIFRRGKELLALGLDVPATARCAMLLKERGIEIDTDFTCDDFADKVFALYAAGKGNPVRGAAKNATVGRASPAPAKTSPAPAKTSPAPAKTSPAPAKTSPAPAEISPAPAKTSPAPAEISSATVETSPAEHTETSPATAESAVKAAAENDAGKEGGDAQ